MDPVFAIDTRALELNREAETKVRAFFQRQQEEYRRLLGRYRVAYDERYVWD